MLSESSRSGARSCAAGRIHGRGPLLCTGRRAGAVRMRRTGARAGGAASAAGGDASRATAMTAGRTRSTWRAESEGGAGQQRWKIRAGREVQGRLVHLPPRPGAAADQNSSGTSGSGNERDQMAVARAESEAMNRGAGCQRGQGRGRAGRRWLVDGVWAKDRVGGSSSFLLLHTVVSRNEPQQPGGSRADGLLAVVGSGIGCTRGRRRRRARGKRAGSGAGGESVWCAKTEVVGVRLLARRGMTA